MLDVRQQILQQIKNAKSILIAFKDIGDCAGYPAGGDPIASALALRQILSKNGKNVDIASPNFVLPEWAKFLPNAETIKNTIQATRQSKIRISIKDSGIKDFTYEIDGDFLNIYFSPRENSIDLKNIETDSGLWQHDLIITLDTAEISLLGKIHEANKALFDNVPIINIDDTGENENYGDINFVDIKSSSVAEIVWRMIEKSPNLDEQIIDCLLAGIIAKTKNFRKSNVNPQTLEIAGKLISLGAKRNEIVDAFYRTKDIATLKIWGRALARLKHQGGVIWSLLARSDFIHSGASEENLANVMHELVSSSPNADIAVLLFENFEGQVKAILYSHKASFALSRFNVVHYPSRLTHIILPHANLVAAEKELIDELKKQV
jgi:phosphoesterase RecJ-like protein